MTNTIRRFGLFLAVLTLSACVSHTPQPGLAIGDTLSVLPPQVKRIDVTVDSKSQKVGKGAALGVVGAVGGGAVGGVTGALFGLGCGPLAIVCSPMFAAAGAGIGIVGGGAMGATYGGRGGISGDKAKLFNEAAATTLNRNSVEIRLGNQFETQANKYWTIESNSPNSVQIKINSFRFEQTGKEHLRLVIRADMEAQLGDKIGEFEFTKTSSNLHIDNWLSDDGYGLQWEIDETIQSLASDMAEVLLVNSRPTVAQAE